MTEPARRRPRRLLPLAALLLAACSDGPSETPKPATCGTGETSLAPGQSAWLSADEQGRFGCRLSPSAGAEYALAFLDTRAIEKARTGPEGYGNVFPDYSVTVDLNGGGPQAAVAPRGAHALSAAVQPHDEALFEISANVSGAPGDGTDPWERATPWAAGEEFMLHDPYAGADRLARVMRVYPNGFVVAWHVGDAPDLVDGTLALMDQAMPEVHARALPLLRRTFVDRLPLSSTGSGQYLLVLRTGGVQNAAAWASTAVLNQDTVRNWLSFKLTSISGIADWVGMASLLTHETTHSFQRMYMHDTRAAGGPPPAAGAALWAVEGGANLLSYEILRRLAGIGFQSNHDWRSGGGPPAVQYYGLRAQPGQAQFTAGYDNSMGFMRDLVIRRMRAGEGLDDALLAVSRGAIEGWFGFDHAGGRRKGLTDRMSERVGAGWAPDEAMLTWALSHAADDRTSSSVYQDRASLRVSQYDSPGQYGWHPEATLEGNGTASATRRYGSPGYLYLRDTGNGVRVDVASSVPGVRWLLVRIGQ